MYRLRRVLLFALLFGLSSLNLAANPVWDSNYVYNKKVYDATSTGGLKKGIRLSKAKAHKRSRKSKGSMRFALIPNKCIRNPTSSFDDDCDRGIRRSQLRSHAAQRMKRKLEYRFSIKKPYRKSDGVLDDYGNPINTLINIFEIKPKAGTKMTNPIFALYLEPKTLKLSVILSRGNHSGGGKQDDVATFNIGRLKPGWNDFRIKTRHTPKSNGYVRLYQKGKLIYSYKGKTSYSYKNDIRYWMGAYICCGRGDLLHKKEPTHLFFYDMVKVISKSKYKSASSKYAKTAYKLSTPFGPSLALAASENMFMVGEDFDRKVVTSGTSFSFDDYSYIEIAPSPQKSFRLGLKSGQDDLPQMGGNFALGYQLGGIHYRLAADNTFLGSKGSGWLGYEDARSAYVNVGKRYYSLGKKWNIAGDVTYGWSQANPEKEGVLQDFSKVHALGFNASAGYQLNSNNALGFRLNAPLKVEKGSLVINSPYDSEKVNLAPVGRELNLVLHHTHQFRNAATLTTSLQYTHDHGHTRDQDSSQIMAEYSISF